MIQRLRFEYDLLAQDRALRAEAEGVLVLPFWTLHAISAERENSASHQLMRRAFAGLDRADMFFNVCHDQRALIGIGILVVIRVC